MFVVEPTLTISPGAPLGSLQHLYTFVSSFSFPLLERSRSFFFMNLKFEVAEHKCKACGEQLPFCAYCVEFCMLFKTVCGKRVGIVERRHAIPEGRVMASNLIMVDVFRNVSDI